MIYKTLKKVSEYCQLLDKRRYPATKTINGVTFTNNGDGTITVNGTASGVAQYLLYNTFQFYFSVIKNHKYLLIVTDIDHNFNFVFGGTASGLGYYEGTAKYIIVTASDTMVGKCYAMIQVSKGVTCNNEPVKPQLFDLTEMYGAGNEPTTVEEFRTKFPNELYDYKPYCFVKSYKNCLKVSDVCQLMVYPYFETTLTRNGITFTDNGDGTITANGTSIGFATFVFSKNFNFIAGNKYYVSTPYSIIAYKENGTMKYAQGNILFTWKSNWEIVQVYMQINKGITVSNLTFKPQIFDLTEMYGAGNEPTTVAEFREKFPDELYDYKPYSIITSYKKSLICTTKNLFDISKLQAYTPETLPTNTAGVYNGTIIARASVNSSVCESGKKLKELCPELVAGETYVLSFEASAKTRTIYLRGANEYWYKNTSSVVTEAMLNSLVGFYANYPELTVAAISNFQIELGDTATEYHPYGYL